MAKSGASKGAKKVNAFNDGKLEGVNVALTQQEARNVISNIKTFTNHGKHKQASDLYNKYFKVGPRVPQA